jgi:hypothetical protein
MRIRLAQAGLPFFMFLFVLEARFAKAGWTTASDFDHTPLWSKSDAAHGSARLPGSR